VELDSWDISKALSILKYPAHTKACAHRMGRYGEVSLSVSEIHGNVVPETCATFVNYGHDTKNCNRRHHADDSVQCAFSWGFGCDETE